MVVLKTINKITYCPSFSIAPLFQWKKFDKTSKEPNFSRTFYFWFILFRDRVTEIYLLACLRGCFDFFPWFFIQFDNYCTCNLFYYIAIGYRLIFFSEELFFFWENKGRIGRYPYIGNFSIGKLSRENKSV